MLQRANMGDHSFTWGVITVSSLTNFKADTVRFSISRSARHFRNSVISLSVAATSDVVSVGSLIKKFDSRRNVAGFVER